MTHVDHSQNTSNRTHSTHRRARLFNAVIALLAVATITAIMAPGADAVSDAEELTRFGGTGEGAGQLKVPFGVATDPLTGHVYVVEEGANNRISEFTPWGNFVKAFGWDVAPGPVNEQQEVRVRAATGQFKLSFGAATTPDLTFDAPGSESEGPGSVEAALNALASIGDAGASVSVEAVPGTPDGAAPYIYVIAFKGSLAGTNVAELTVANGTTPLSGGIPSTGLEARTRAEGAADSAGFESCTKESSCKAGLGGGGAGELNDGEGVAVDADGNVYVSEVGNHRVQKFDSAGRFVLMFGGEVNKTTNKDICTFASGDECGPGVVGSGEGEFAQGAGSGVALCPSGVLCPGGALFVADADRIQRFNLQGEFEASIPTPGKIVHFLALDPISGDLYVHFSSDGEIHKLDSTTGTEVGQAIVSQTTVLATDLGGNVYAAGSVLLGQENVPGVLQFGTNGKPLSPPSCCVSPLWPFPNPLEEHFGIYGLGTNAIGDLYITHFSPNIDSFIRSFGPGPTTFEAPPTVPPTIEAQFATSVERKGATVAAEINPHFWTNTRYYVQYGTGKCSEGGCESEKPLSPGTILTSKPIDRPVKSAGVALEGLEPGTTYHYRFVSQSSGGGPVRGIGGEVGVDGEESTFITYPAPLLKVDCPNQHFRTGFSAPLPDCRAFEMVSPIDKNNGDVVTLFDSLNNPTALDQSSSDGDRFTYSSYRAFADPKAASYTSQYMATRKDGVGWSSEAINPPQSHAASDAGSVAANFVNAYKAFSADLCGGWLVVAADPLLAPGAVEGYHELYRRDDCGGGSHEALIQVEPTLSPGAFNPEFQGASADGAKAIFRVPDKLTTDAVSGVWQTYYASEGELHLICVLPNGSPSGGDCSAGTGDSREGGQLGVTDQNRLASVSHAISADGSRVYWTDSAGKESFPGKVYLRLNPGQEQSELSGGECTEAEKACTLKVSESVSTKASHFLGASADGGKALFEVIEGNQEGNLYRFDLEEAGASTLIAGETLGVAGASEDLSRVYFVSEEALVGAAQAGEPNLYLDQEGTKTFIATLAESELFDSVAGVEIASNNAPWPVLHAARVSPDGSHLAFISTELLTGYDNTDQATGEADSEVYLYEAGGTGPVCVSCNPSAARPQGRAVRQRPTSNAQPTAASIPVAQSIHHFPRSLSVDGSRIFFNSYDALLPRDSNGKADVYGWEAASSEKECEENGAEIYVGSSGGCLSLISSGQSPEDSTFLDASPSGDDVFFTTNASLLPQDPGLIDVYDARAGGGLPAPPEPPGPCQGEACQLAPPPPNDPTPASASFKGAGNLKPTPRCRKGKVARKGRCVAKKRKAAKRHAKRDTNRNRGASR